MSNTTHLESKAPAVLMPEPVFPSCPRVHPDIIIDYTAQGDVILLHPVQARWALTNQEGLALARAFDGSVSVREIVARQQQNYPSVPPQTLQDDVFRFLTQLHDSNLIENAPVPAPPPSPRRAPKPPSLTIYITEECNLRCKHCAIVEGKMPPTTLTAEEICALIDQHTAEYDNPTVCFLGGEPTLRPDCIDMLEHAATRTKNLTMSTNGLLIDEEKARRIAALGMELQVSLDGADPEVHDFIRGRGAYDKTWAAIELLVSHGTAARLTISTALTRAALPQVRELIARADRMGIGILRFLNLNKMRAAVTNWDRIAPEQSDLREILHYLLLDLPREDRVGKTAVRGSLPGYVPDANPNGSPWCPLGKTLIVDSQGKTYNCPVLNTPEFAIGDIRKETLKEMQEGEVNRATRERMLQRRYVIEECRTCAWRNFCQSGCQAFTSLRSGDIHLNDEFCDLRRDLYRSHVRRTARLE